MTRAPESSGWRVAAAALIVAGLALAGCSNGSFADGFPDTYIALDGGVDATVAPPDVLVAELGKPDAARPDIVGLPDRLADLPSPRDVARRDAGRPVPDLPIARDTPPDAGTPEDIPVADDGPLPPDAAPETETPPVTASVEIYALDLWAQALPATGATLRVRYLGDDHPGATSIDTVGFPVASVELPWPGDYEVALEAPDHHPAAVEITWDGSEGTDAVGLLPRGGSAAASEGPGVSLAHRDNGGAAAHSLFIGLRHKWFAASGPPARRGNHVTLLMDGEEAWTAAREAMLGAQYTIHLSTWWWSSDFELLRPWPSHMTMSEEERAQNTILFTLWSTPAVIRTLVGQFWGQDSILDWLTRDDELLAIAEDPDDGWEFLGMGNPTTGRILFEVPPFHFRERVQGAWPESSDYTFDFETAIPSPAPSEWVDLTDFPFGFETEIASYHQKFFVVDDEHAFVGGMNLRTVDWDSSAHEVFEPRRMDFTSSTADRQAVADKADLPDNGPRKDYMVHVEGPSVLDVAEVFQARWHHQIDSGVDFADNASHFELWPYQTAYDDGVQAQITVTLPEPFHRASIFESWLAAIGNAEHYIFIEDQYWRIPVLNEAIAARMEAVPGLLLLVVTKPVSEWTDPGCRWTHETNALFSSRFPSRYATYQLRAFDYHVACTLCFEETEAVFQDMDVHSKLLMVDDRYVSVGSCNKNNRGVHFEGEMNVDVLNEDFVRAARQRIVGNMLAVTLSPASTFDEVWDAFKTAATYNDAVYARWEDEGFDLDLDGGRPPERYLPDGFVYSVSFGSVDDCLIEDIGPDIAK